MSREHSISAKLLRRLVEDRGLNIQGFPWQGEGWRKVSVDPLASNILCRRHNSDLSALDDIGEKFVDHLERIGSEYTAWRPSWFWVLNGHDLERWLL